MELGLSYLEGRVEAAVFVYKWDERLAFTFNLTCGRDRPKRY
jgi:hypothetical protein